MEGLPGKKHLEKLPLRAIVAFAARSARRVMSPSHTPDLQPDGVWAVSEIEVLVSHAEDFAANTTTTFRESLAGNIPAS